MIQSFKPQLQQTERNALAAQITELITQLQRRFLVNISARVNATKISIPQFTLLSFLATRNHCTMGQLAAMMGHTTPATTGLVNRLVESGLVERQSCPEDRRQVLIAITPQGRKIVEDMRQEMCGHVSKILERLGPEDSEAWLRIYQVILTYCEETRGS